MAIPPPPPGFEPEDNQALPPVPEGFEPEGMSMASAVPPPPPGFEPETEEASLSELGDMVGASRLGSIGRGVDKLGKVLEPLRAATVGLGGILAGTKAKVMGKEFMPAADKSVRERAGLGKEIVNEFISPGWGQELASVAMEIATDPGAVLAGSAASKMFGVLGKMAEARRVANMSQTLDAAISGHKELRAAMSADFDKAFEIMRADEALTGSITGAFNKQQAEKAAAAQAARLKKSGDINNALEQTKVLKDEAYRELNEAQRALDAHKKQYAFESSGTISTPVEGKSDGLRKAKQAAQQEVDRLGAELHNQGGERDLHIREAKTRKLHEAERRLAGIEAKIADNASAAGSGSADAAGTYKVVAQEREALERAVAKAKLKTQNLLVWNKELRLADDVESANLAGQEALDRAMAGFGDGPWPGPLSPEESARLTDPAGTFLDDLKRIAQQQHDARKAGLNPKAAMSDEQASLLAKANTTPELAAIFSEAESKAMREALSGKSAVPEIVAEVTAPLNTIETKVSVPKRPGEDLATYVGRKVDALSLKMKDAAEALETLNAHAVTAIQHVDTIVETGTLPKAVRPGFSNSVLPLGASERNVRANAVSYDTVKASGAKLTAVVREYKAILDQVRAGGDIASANTAIELGQQLAAAEKKMNVAVEQWRLQRYSSNRALQAFNGPVVPSDVIDTLKASGRQIENLRQVKERMPITTNVIEGLKKIRAGEWQAMKEGEKWQFANDLINNFKLNLFSSMSFTLDAVVNGTELTAQALGKAGADVARSLSEQSFSAPGVRGMGSAVADMISSMRHGSLSNGMPKAIQDQIVTTVNGEYVLNPKHGTFTMRSTPFSKFYDYLVGTPLYMKGALDNVAKRVGSMAHVYQEAYIAAAKLKLSGADKDAFVAKYMQNIPEDVVTKALEYGNKAGFNRDLSYIEERYAKSYGVQLFLDTFARWPFQFTRWGAEMLGYNPGVMKRGPAAIGEYMAKTATGWGGLWLLNNTMYDRMDFNTMEYVHPDGGRSRFSNRDPITTGMFLLAVMKGDSERAKAALQFASMPMAKAISYTPGSGYSLANGGMLSPFLNLMQQSVSQRRTNPRIMADEFAQIVNRMIPGQALLGSLKTVFDPTIRHGIGSNMPLLSYWHKPVVNAATGENLVPYQEIPLINMQVPSVMGTPFPGAKRVLDPVEKLLFKYGISVNRPMRTSIAGIPENNIKDEWKDEWLRLLGKERQRNLRPFLDGQPESQRLEMTSPEMAREIILSIDAMSAKLATIALEKKYGKTIFKPESPNRKRDAGPKEYEKFRGNPLFKGDQIKKALEDAKLRSMKASVSLPQPSLDELPEDVYVPPVPEA